MGAHFNTQKYRLGQKQNARTTTVAVATTVISMYNNSVSTNNNNINEPIATCSRSLVVANISVLVKLQHGHLI